MNKRNIIFLGIILSVATVSYYIYTYFRYPLQLGQTEELVLAKEDTVKQKQHKFFDIAIDTLTVESKKVKWTQNLSDILNKYGVTNQQIYEIGHAPKHIFDVRKFKRGRPYHLISTRDNRLVHFIYEDSQREFVTISFMDTVRVLRTTRKTETVLRASKGTIKSSLWNTLVDEGLNPVLANELSDVYAWTIDFFGIQKGDEFKVLYEEEFIDSNSLGIKKIYAAYFKHMKEDYWAFGFNQDDKDGFYDEKGESLRKAFLKAPLKYSRVSSGFSYSRMHPILRIRRPHTGVDYAAPTGTPVMTIGDGIIIKKGYNRAAGNYIEVKHNSIYKTRYNHFSKFGKGIAVGRKVKQGDIVGYVGSTGYATGPHLDFRFWKNGKAVDPLKVKAPPVEPVKNTNKEEFSDISSCYKKLFDYI